MQRILHDLHCLDECRAQRGGHLRARRVGTGAEPVAECVPIAVPLGVTQPESVGEPVSINVGPTAAGIEGAGGAAVRACQSRWDDGHGDVESAVRSRECADLHLSRDGITGRRNLPRDIDHLRD